MHLKIHVCDMPDRGVASAAVLAVLDPRRYLADGAGPSRPDPAVIKLRFQSCEETFGFSVVPANPGISHRPDDAVGGCERGDLRGGVLGAAVGMEDTDADRLPQRARAICSASWIRSVRMWSAMAHPMTRRLWASMTVAR